MRATKVKGAVACPVCCMTIDPLEYEDFNPKETSEVWVCPDCEAVDDSDNCLEEKSCSHDPPEVVAVRCPNCEDWVDPADPQERKRCPLCEEWFDPEQLDFDETEAYRCGECETVYGDRDEAKECCR